MSAPESEAVQTLGSLRDLLDTIVVRGVLASTSADVSALSLHRDTLAQAGAAGLAHTLDVLVTALRVGDRSAIAPLMAARAKVRVFERLLTLRHVRRAFEAASEDSAAAEEA